MDRRNPQYGDDLIALESYSHIDRPNTTAREPQFILDNNHINQTGNDGSQKPEESSPMVDGQDRDAAQME